MPAPVVPAARKSGDDGEGWRLCGMAAVGDATVGHVVLGMGTRGAPRPEQGQRGYVTTVYKVGGRLYEGAHREVNGRRCPYVRTWDILSVVPDPTWQGDDGEPLQVVTLRANVRRAPKYMAESADYLDNGVSHGLWRRTRKAAEAMIATWAGYQPKKARQK